VDTADDIGEPPLAKRSECSQRGDAFLSHLVCISDEQSIAFGQSAAAGQSQWGGGISGDQRADFASNWFCDLIAVKRLQQCGNSLTGVGFLAGLIHFLSDFPL
jgi:hypothetical protein